MPELDITPEQAGWAFCGLRVLELEPGASRSLRTGEDELIVLPLEGAATVTLEGERVRARGSRERLRRGHGLRVCPTRLRARDRLEGRRALRAALRPRAAPARAPPRGRGVGRRRAARRGPGEPPDQQLLRARRPLRRSPDRRRGPHPRGELVLVSAAQARRGRARRRDRARGDLLLRGRQRRLRLPARLRPGDRHLPGGPHRRHRAAAQRLPRTVDGGARLRPLLPERHGGAQASVRGGSPTIPRTPGSGIPGRGRRSTRAFPWPEQGGTHEVDGRTGAHPLPRQPVHGARRRRAAADRGLLRDLRPRQRGGRRPGAAPGGGRSLPPRAQRAGHGARGRRVRADEEPAVDAGLHGVGRAGRHQHGHRRRPGDDQPAAGAPAPRRHLRHPRGEPGAAGARGPRRPTTSRSTTASSRSRASGIGSTAPSSCPRRCWRPCAC